MLDKVKIVKRTAILIATSFMLWLMTIARTIFMVTDAVMTAIAVALAMIAAAIDFDHDWLVRGWNFLLFLLSTGQKTKSQDW